MKPDVIIVGGGPAGMMAGFLLARAGVPVLVLEKHADFFRDFRGDTVHPSTMAILAELGLLDRFLARPHNRIDRAEIWYNGRHLTIGDLTHLTMPAPFIAMMPQWDFLDFLRDEARAFPAFALRMEAEATGLVEEGERTVGVRLASGEHLRARRLVLCCDGRGAFVRQVLPLESLGAPIDVFWFAVPKVAEGSALRGVIRGHRLFVLIDRGTYWQCAAVIAKGGAEEVRARGIDAFRADVLTALPEVTDIAAALPDWDAVRLLSVSLDRLTEWSRPGLLAIGDAAHAMSPVGGIGINLAIQDAVATANILAAPLAAGRDVDALLEKVQRRRFWPTRVIQGLQRAAHERVLQPLIEGRASVPAEPPLPLRALDRFPLLRRIPGHFIGHGIRQEHVRSPNAARRG
ncbi:FAD-dependent oxidoreductase [Tsuneonella sp. YG55]|uniref:FAD-dependent oxidoreductase n=1 Tax=Tsuneonella litorea TaxID=2976475 RepID=A0A9X3AL06_9SPHN|nr:FAD-dependent oxidoreductase [Tsuneonella litorea]MCT2559054.1 FAD-dependent oxidoreductase [Tsuneonella litorea]